MEPERVEAWIARGRVKEMLAKGWRAVGPIREDVVLMSGPDPDTAYGADAGFGAVGPHAIGQWIPAVLPAAVRLRQAHGAAMAQALDKTTVRVRSQVA